jgi:chromosome partitioning protein
MIVLVANKKGGTGKSTIALNLAVEAQRQGLDVQLVEADPSIHTSSYWADDRAQNGLPHLLTVRTTGRINEDLTAMNGKYDIVVVDTGKDTQEMRTAMMVADAVVVPAKPSQTDLESSKELVEVILNAQETTNPTLKPLLVLSQASTHPMSKEVQDAREFVGDAMPVADSVIYQRSAYRRCLETGKGVTEMDDRKAKAEIQLLMNEITELAGR